MKPKGKQMMSNFTAVDPRVYLRLVCNVEGTQKCGKSHFALTAPGPIYVLNFDLGLEGVVQKFLPDKEVKAATYNYDLESGKSVWDKQWDKFVVDFRDGLKSAATVIVDTMSEAWALLRLARFGKLEQVRPHHYSSVNAEMRGLLREALVENTKANVILVHRRKNLWMNDKRTDILEMEGFSEIPFLCQVNVLVERVADDPAFPVSLDNWKFQATVVDCRHDMRLTGTRLEGDDFNFEFLRDMVLGGY